MLGNERPEASLPGEIVSHGFSGEDWYDYSAKYDEGGMDLVVPPRISSRRRSSASRSSPCRRSSPTECEGMARVDCFVTPATARCSSTS